MKVVQIALMGVLSTGAPGQRQDLVLVPNASFDRVYAYDAATGARVDTSFIDLGAATGGLAQTPLEIIAVNNEYWVSDSGAGMIFRFDRASRGYLGGIAAEGVRGLEYADGVVYAALNPGVGSSSIAMIDPVSNLIDGTFESSAAAGEFWDVQARGNEMLVSGTTAAEDGGLIERYSPSGAHLGLVHSNNTTIADLRQIYVEESGELLVAGNVQGRLSPGEVFEIIDSTHASSVTVLKRLGSSDSNGVYRLGNGVVFETRDAWGFLTFETIPAPASIGLFVGAGLLTTRRRR